MTPSPSSPSVFPPASAVILMTLALTAFTPETLRAQPIGTFRWQVQPYCNVVTVALTQTGGIFRLEGTDDRCGAGGTAASVIGTAFFNANGTIGLGLNIAAPGGEATQIDATVTLPSASGTWRDTAGHSGAFVLTPGAGTGGTMRPAAGPVGAANVDAAQVQLRVTGACPAGQYMQSVGQGGAVTCAAVAGTAGGTITGVAAGTGLTGGGTGGGVTLAVNPAVVQSRVSGTCPAGQFMQSVGQGGTVTCTAPPGGGGGTITGVIAGVGLSGGGTAGSVSLALPATPAGVFDLSSPNGAVFAGTLDQGAVIPLGMGPRMLWNPRKAAFRAGFDKGLWNDANVGYYSAAFGGGSTASADSSTAFGASSTASGHASVAGGVAARALGIASTAFGWNAQAGGDESVALGMDTTANGSSSVAIGRALNAQGSMSVVLGSNAGTAGNGTGSFVFGDFSLPGVPVISSIPNQFLVRAAGGVVFWSTGDTTYPTGPGVALYSGAGGWSGLSDVNAKENFRDLAGENVLQKIAQIPVREWNYKAQDAAIRHMGPTAQDFYAAFGLGEDEHRINSIDADGVALAAVRALEARTRALQDENTNLRDRLERLERLLEKTGGVR